MNNIVSQNHPVAGYSADNTKTALLSVTHLNSRRTMPIQGDDDTLLVSFAHNAIRCDSTAELESDAPSYFTLI